MAKTIHRTADSAGSPHYFKSLEEMTGETPNISEYLDFTFYDWCWNNDNSGLGENKLGKCLGIYHHFGSIMYYWVLPANGSVVSRTTVSRVTNLKAQTDENKARITALDKAIQERLNDEAHVIVEGGKGKPKDWSEYLFERDPYFHEKFSHVVFNEEVAEASDGL